MQAPLPTMRTSYNSYTVPEPLMQFATTVNEHLNKYNDTLFNFDYLNGTPEAFSRLIPSAPNTLIKFFELEVSQHQKVRGTHISRDSKTLVIIIGGFTNKHEVFASLIQIFPRYDLVFFDLPGHGINAQEDCEKESIITQLLFGSLRVKELTWGRSEVQHIVTVIDHFRKQTTYEKIIGVGFCYSVMFLVQAAVQWQQSHMTPLFDKLILDSAWSSYASLIQNLPRLKAIRSGSPFLVALAASYPVRRVFLELANKFFAINFEDLPPLTWYLHQLKAIDILFVHSHRDAAISDEEFEKVWQSALHLPHIATLFTYNQHVCNHVQQKELFKLVSELFIELPFDLFIRSTTNDTNAQFFHELLLSETV